MKDPSGDVPPKSQIEPKLIGIVSEMLPVGIEWEVEIPPKKPLNKGVRPEKKKVLNVWHSGLSVVVPVDYLIELIDALPKLE
jgi:hypothetical protein